MKAGRSCFRALTAVLLCAILRPGSSLLPSSGRRCGHSISSRTATPDGSTEIDLGSTAVTATVSQELLAGLAKLETVMAPDFVDHCGEDQASLKQLHSQIIKSVEVKESSISGAGLGLFATKNIKAGSIVSFYPAHTLGVEVNDQSIFVAPEGSDQDYFREHPPDSSSYLHATDQPIFNRPSLLAKSSGLGGSTQLKDAPLYLDVNPQRTPISPAWVSQYINDGAILRESSEAGVTAYYKESKGTKNCIHIPFGPSPILATVATKKVKKGDELFTSYGCVYWLGVLYPEDGAATALTGPIQAQIQDSAQDLFAAMKSVSTRYTNQIETLESIFQ